MLNIRPATPKDYLFVTESFRLYNPHYSATPEAIERYDQDLEPHILRRRVIAELDDQAVGYMVFSHNQEYFHPQRFWINGFVLPSYTCRGIGSALHDYLLQELRPHNPTLIEVNARESWPRSLRFLEHRGFVEGSRAWESHLDPRAFDPSPYCHAETKVLEQGFEIKSYTELADDPERDTKYWQLEMALTADMPSSFEFTSFSFKHFQRKFLESPDFIPEANLFAVAPDGHYVGLNALWKNSERNLGNGTTGTLKEYKRRGIALALKVKNLIWAKEHGYHDIKTFNRSDNLPMWSINERLGFQREPAWINLEKKF